MEFFGNRGAKMAETRFMLSKIASRVGSEFAPADAPIAPDRSQPAVEPERASFKSIVARLGREIDRGEALVGRAVYGSHSGLDAAGLIALQAGIYRYSEAVDLAAKMVDRAGSAIKTTLSGGSG